VAQKPFPIILLIAFGVAVIVGLICLRWLEEAAITALRETTRDITVRAQE
jgi:hypothetical protein